MSETDNLNQIQINSCRSNFVLNEHSYSPREIFPVGCVLKVDN